MPPLADENTMADIVLTCFATASQSSPVLKTHMHCMYLLKLRLCNSLHGLVVIVTMTEHRGAAKCAALDFDNCFRVNHLLVAVDTVTMALRHCTKLSTASSQAHYACASVFQIANVTTMSVPVLTRCAIVSQ